MTLHTIAYFINAQGVSLTEMTAIQDDVLTITSPTRFLVPPEYNYVHFGYAAGTLTQEVRISSPSLEVRRFPVRLWPIHGAHTNPPIDQDRIARLGGLELVPTEELRVLITLASASAAADHTVVLMLGPRELRTEDVRGAFLARATFSGARMALRWTSFPITFETPLESGRYRILGAYMSANAGVFGRLIVPGQLWRPPVYHVGATPLFRALINYDVVSDWLGLVYGEFDHTTPPQVQLFASSGGDTSGELYLLLKKVR